MQKNMIQAAQERQQSPVKVMQSHIRRMKLGIQQALPTVITQERFTRIALTAVSANPQLAQTTPESFLGAMMTAAQLGLEPNTPLGQAYLIPYWSNKKQCYECQFQIGYKGLIDLAYRSGDVSTIQAHTVYQNDTFEYELGLEPKLRHIPAMSERGEPICFYAVFRTKDGGYGFDVMSAADVRAFAQRYSKSYSSGPWKSNFEGMAKKTVLKRVLKYAPLKSEFVRQMAQDETVKLTLDADMSSVPDETPVAWAVVEGADDAGQDTPDDDPPEAQLN